LGDISTETARASMSKALFILLEDNRKKYFEHYDEPLHFLSAYRRNKDGYGLITHIMQRIHPNLESTSNRKAPKAPVFLDYDTIYSFIDTYIDWIDNEKIESRSRVH
jgi:hypothetical protein